MKNQNEARYQELLKAYNELEYPTTNATGTEVEDYNDKLDKIREQIIELGYPDPSIEEQPKEPIKITLFNSDKSERWVVLVIQVGNEYHVEDYTRHSLFSNPLAKGNTPGEAIDNFIKVESDLINSL